MDPYRTGTWASNRLWRNTGQSRREFLINSGRAMLLGTGLAAAIGRVRTAGAASHVTLGVATLPCQAPAYGALTQGFFGDEGLDVTVVSFADVGAVLPALVNGSIDTGLTTVWAVVPPRLPSSKALGDVVITAGLQRGCLALSVPADSPVQTLEGLRGQNVAGSKFLYGSGLAEAGVNPDTDITWSPAPPNADVFKTLQSGQFAAVQSADGQGALLEVVGAARMIAMNNMPPAESFYCCASVMDVGAVHDDPSRAAAITRALMRGSIWAEEHRSETAAAMLPEMTVPAQRALTQEDMESALAMQAFVPMAESARPVLVGQYEEYLRYGLPVDPPLDAATLVDRIFLPVTEEVMA
jgi:NitT/TauT family transport system substrate-binding protein